MKIKMYEEEKIIVIINIFRTIGFFTLILLVIAQKINTINFISLFLILLIISQLIINGMHRVIINKKDEDINK